ncbi:hypothetical protein N9D99_06485 [Gammaproteobacteria bacterium]|nr:hypothetical protein [Gammaproteobacteria bacterium]MDB2445389.1 hypothetical protein [Gammaproteobacteria bacterium]
MGLMKTDEVTYVVTMNVNGKSEEQVDTFSEFYQKLVDGNESTTFGWQFFRGTDAKIYLIERYKNADAALQHITNISPGGIAENEFKDFSDHFSIEMILIHGEVSEGLEEALEAIGLPVEFRKPIAGYSRS